MATDTSPETIIAQAQALIEEAQRSLDAGDALYTDMGLDPEEARAQLQAQLTPAMREQAQQAFEKVRQEAEDRVQEALARAAFNTPHKASKPTRRPRFMV